MAGEEKITLHSTTGIEVLYCYGLNLTKLDVTQAPTLTTLACLTSQLTTLDLSKNPNLALVYCYGNPLLPEIRVMDVNNVPSGFSKDNDAIWVQG